MAAFPRAIVPAKVSPLRAPGGYLNTGQTGKHQRRNALAVGFSWTETFNTFDATSVNGAALLAFLEEMWWTQASFTIDYRPRLTALGLGTGAPLVAGVNQTGSSLATDTWTGANPVLRAGDIIKIAGITNIFLLRADAPNLAAGATTLAILPSIFVGGSPADNAAITYQNVQLTAILAEQPNIPDMSEVGYIGGLALKFVEAP